jgi:hypothetical protein
MNEQREGTAFAALKIAVNSGISTPEVSNSPLSVTEYK